MNLKNLESRHSLYWITIEKIFVEFTEAGMLKGSKKSLKTFEFSGLAKACMVVTLIFFKWTIFSYYLKF